MIGPLRVQDILTRPVFRYGQLIAGHAGLSRTVKWVHILDVADVRTLINGDELVLTTGLGVQHSDSAFEHFVEQLIVGGAAGLCVELGTAIEHIPPSIRDLANTHAFPLIVFTKQVRFVDITQDIHSLILIQERQMFYEQDWVEQVVRRQDVEQLNGRTGTPRPSAVRYCAMVLRIPDPGASRPTPESGQSSERSNRENWYQRKADLSMMVRAAFSKQRFRIYLAVRPDITVAVLELEASDVHWKTKLTTAVEALNTSLSRNGCEETIAIGVGTDVECLTAVPDSYREAMTALHFGVKLSHSNGLVFYDDAGIYRWIALLGHDHRAQALAHHELLAVIKHDGKYHANLLETLRVYLDCDRSKQQTADRLFIHRQTLYHRLEQIEQLLHIDLENPSQRLALHLALYVYNCRREE